MQPATRRWLIVILLAGAVLRFVPIWFGLPYPQARPDEETALGRAVDVLHGQLNPRFFHWPSLTFYLFAGVLWIARHAGRLLELGRELTFSEQAVVARAVVATAGTATIFLLFRLARRIAGEHTALVAAAFLAVAILHVRESHFAMTDALTTMFVVMSLTLLIVVVHPSREDRDIPPGAVWWCAAAGLAAGLATSTKYSAAAVAASMWALQLWWFVRRPRFVLQWRTWLPSLAYGAAMIGGFLAGTPYSVLDYPTFSTDLLFDFTHLSEGHSGVVVGRGWTYHLTHSLPYGVGIPVFVAAIAGVVPFVRFHTAAAAVIGSFGLAFYLMIGSGYTVFFRYMLPVVPIVCLVAAIGVTHAANWLSAALNVGRRAVLVILLAVTVGPSLVQSAWFDLLLARTDTRVLTATWLEARLKPEDSLHDAGGNYTRLNLWRASFHAWYYDESTESFGDSGRLPDWLVLHESPLTTYASIPSGLRPLAQSRYVLVYTARATRGRARSATYDRQDAFFMPFSGFSTILRPGPDIRVYRRGDLPPIH